MKFALKISIVFLVASLPIQSTNLLADAPKKSSNDAKKAFEQRDVDKDGFLTREEFKSLMKEKTNRDKADTWFEQRDKDGDGKLSFDEFRSGRSQKKKK
jgi:Ca2+-binding EF-hand superfamily protein